MKDIKDALVGLSLSAVACATGLVIVACLSKSQASVVHSIFTSQNFRIIAGFSAAGFGLGAIGGLTVAFNDEKLEKLWANKFRLKNPKFPD